MNVLPLTAQPLPIRAKFLSAAAALMAAVGVALAAYASHGLHEQARYWGLLAAAFLLAHGIALATLVWTPPALTRLGYAGLCGIGLGCVVFCGSLLGAALFGLPTRLAPFGGGMLIASWLAYAIACWRVK